MQDTLAHEHVSTQDTLAREHISARDMLAREHVSAQGTLAREHVSAQGTLAREHVNTQVTVTCEHVFSSQHTQFSRLLTVSYLSAILIMGLFAVFTRRPKITEIFSSRQLKSDFLFMHNKCFVIFLFFLNFILSFFLNLNTRFDILKTFLLYKIKNV